MLTIRACGTEARKTLAHSRFSNGRSAAYFVSPVTFPSPSMRGSPFPMVRNAKVHLPVLFSILDTSTSLSTGFECRDLTQHRFTIVGLRIQESERIIAFIVWLPQSKIGNRKSKISSYDLVRPLDYAVRNRQANLFGHLKVKDEFKRRCLLHRQIG